jgi:hypothetical protein
MFEPAEAKQISQGQWSRKIKSGKDFFTKSEHQTFIDLMEKSGREYVTEEDWDKLTWWERKDNFVIGLTFLTYYIKSGDDNPVPVEVHLHKCPDEWFMVSFYQDDYGDYEGNIYGTYEEYYECDGFESVLDLLKIQ